MEDTHKSLEKKRKVRDKKRGGVGKKKKSEFLLKITCRACKEEVYWKLKQLPSNEGKCLSWSNLRVLVGSPYK